MRVSWLNLKLVMDSSLNETKASHLSSQHRAKSDECMVQVHGVLADNGDLGERG